MRERIQHKEEEMGERIQLKGEEMGERKTGEHKKGDWARGESTGREPTEHHVSPVEGSKGGY